MSILVWPSVKKNFSVFSAGPDDKFSRFRDDSPLSKSESSESEYETYSEYETDSEAERAADEKVRVTQKL